MKCENNCTPLNNELLCSGGIVVLEGGPLTELVEIDIVCVDGESLVKNLVCGGSVRNGVDTRFKRIVNCGGTYQSTLEEKNLWERARSRDR